MRKTKLALLALLGLTLAGCVLSLNPLFKDGDGTFDPALNGVWEAPEGKGTFTFRGFPADKFYSLETHFTNQPKAEFNAVLGTVGKHRFLQLVPRRPDNIHAKSFYGGHFIQACSFWKVTLESNSLTLMSLDYRWVERMDKAKKLDIQHEQQEGGFIILTAPTEELKAFVLKYADDTSAFSDGLTFERKK